MIGRIARSFCAVLVPAILLVFAVGLGAEKASWKQRRANEDPFFAAEHGYLRSLRRLIAREPELLSRTTSPGETLLHFAARGDEAEIVAYLVGAGAEIDARDRLGYTPLHAAAMAGATEAAKALISSGADPEARKWSPELNASRPGASVLDIAAMGGDAELVELLLERNVPVRHADFARTALHWASMGLSAPRFRDDPECAGNRKVIALLVKEFEDVNLRDAGHRTPLLVAAAHASPETVEYLLENHPKVDIHAQDAEGNTALHLAVFTPEVKASAERRAAVVRVLLDYGAPRALRNSDGETPLERARRNADAEVAKAFGNTRMHEAR